MSINGLRRRAGFKGIEYRVDGGSFAARAFVPHQGEHGRSAVSAVWKREVSARRRQSAGFRSVPVRLKPVSIVWTWLRFIARSG